MWKATCSTSIPHLYLFDVAKPKNWIPSQKGDRDEDAAEWSPDGKQIVFVSNHSADPEENDNDDIFVMDAKP